MTVLEFDFERAAAGHGGARHPERLRRQRQALQLLFVSLGGRCPADPPRSGDPLESDQRAGEMEPEEQGMVARKVVR